MTVFDLIWMTINVYINIKNKNPYQYSLYFPTALYFKLELSYKITKTNRRHVYSSPTLTLKIVCMLLKLALDLTQALTTSANRFKFHSDFRGLVMTCPSGRAIKGLNTKTGGGSEQQSLGFRFKSHWGHKFWTNEWTTSVCSSFT